MSIVPLLRIDDRLGPLVFGIQRFLHFRRDGIISSGRLKHAFDVLSPGQS